MAKEGSARKANPLFPCGTLWAITSGRTSASPVFFESAGGASLFIKRVGGRINACFGVTVKEISATEVTLMDARERDPLTAQEKMRIKNDYVFALIGGDKPTGFLERLGIKVG